MRDLVIARDDGLCAICGLPGADSLGHVTPYRDLPAETRDRVDLWNPADFRATHAACERRHGARPLQEPA